MSEPNIIHAQGLYAAFGRGDLDHIIRACAPDVTWEVVGRPADFPAFGTRRGPDGVTEFFRALMFSKTINEFTPRGFHVSRDKVFVEGHERATLNSCGSQIDTEWLHVFTFKDGTLKAFREFYDTAQYAEARRA